jgi:hypothetical protein
MRLARCTTVGILLVVATFGCGQPFELEEHAPGPASVWLTSDPAEPTGPVPVSMRSPRDPGIQFSHTFVAGETLRGDFATSQGEYQLAAFGGACTLDVSLGPSDMAEVLLTINNEGCAFAIERVVDMDDPAAFKDEPSVLIMNQGGGNETPVIEPVAPSP